MSKKIRKLHITAFLLAVILACGSLSSCSFLENTEFVFTTGLSGDQLFKIGKSVCTLPEAMIYVMDYQQQYESVYGVEMWEHDFGGVTLEEYVKDTIIAKLASVKAVTLLAGEYEVELDDDEEAAAVSAAQIYYYSLSAEQIEYMGLDLDTVAGLYGDHALSEKVYAVITSDVNTEISDDEARIITVQQILLETREEAEEVLEEIEAGEKDFATAASTYSLSDQVTVSIGRGDVDEAYEEAAFALENDGISGVIETDEGFYLIKCIDNYDQEATEANKVTMLEERCDEAFSSVYESFISQTSSQFNDSLWEEVSFSNWTGSFPENFLDIYEEYFGDAF